MERDCRSLLAWVSVANEGQGDNSFRDLLVCRKDMFDAAGSLLYSWSSCRGVYGDSDGTVLFDSAEDVAGEQFLQATPATRVYVVDCSRHISASMHAFFNQRAGLCTTEAESEEVGAEVAHGKLVQWAAHCAFMCAPGTMVVL